MVHVGILLKCRSQNGEVGISLNSLHFLKIYFYFMHMSVLHTCTKCPQRPEKDDKSVETGITGACEPPHGCWGSNLVLLQGQCFLSQLCDFKVIFSNSSQFNGAGLTFVSEICEYIKLCTLGSNLVELYFLQYFQPSPKHWRLVFSGQEFFHYYY